MIYNKALANFPYPFKGDHYRYSNNSVPLETESCVEISPNYRDDMHLKRHLLSHHPERCYKSLAHTIDAQWEVLELVCHHLVEQYPENFVLNKAGDTWTFKNNLLNEEYTFRLGDLHTLTLEPLDFIGRHVQEDLLLMMQKDNNLFLEAGQLCFPANWSLAFNLGMNFNQIHSPIPGFKEEGLDNRILRFLLGLQPSSPWWRLNWSLMAGNRLDTSLETFDQWGKDRKNVTKENAGELVHLRVEVQKLFRLPRSHAILFTIHTHILPIHRLVDKPDWLIQFQAIIQELPDYISNYKGIGLYRDPLLDYLEEQIKSIEDQQKGEGQHD